MGTAHGLRQKHARQPSLPAALGTLPWGRALGPELGRSVRLRKVGGDILAKGYPRRTTQAHQGPRNHVVEQVVTPARVPSWLTHSNARPHPRR